MATDTEALAPTALTKSRGGRPARLDGTLREVVIALVASGLSRTAAARQVGVAPQTVFNTAIRDPEFGRRLEQAANELQFAHLRIVQRASGRSWRASAWALERIAPERFGDPDRRSRRRAVARVWREAMRRLRAEAIAICRQELGSKLSAAEIDRLSARLSEAIDEAARSASENVARLTPVRRSC